MRFYIYAFLLLSHVAFGQNPADPVGKNERSDWAQFFINQFANPRELLTDSALSALFDVSLGELSKSLGKNPNAKLILRDFSKIPGLSANVFQGNEVAGTGYLYDESHLFGHATKISTKLASFMFLRYLGFTPGNAAIWANVPGDSVGRLFLIAGQMRQNLQTSESFHSFFLERFQTKWLSDTFMQQLPNLPIMHILGSLAGSYALGDKIQGLILANMGALFACDVKVGATFGQNAATANSISQKAKIFLIMTLASTSEKAFFNFVFPPISRVMMSFGVYLKNQIPSLPDFRAKREEL